ncbi:MAG: Ig-like domain-containing protein [bacterium]
MTGLVGARALAAMLGLASVSACGDSGTSALLGGEPSFSGNSGQGSSLPAASLVLTPRNLSVSVGASAQITVAARDEHGTLIVRPVTWRSSNPGVATVTVTDTGKAAIGKSVGTTFVYATLDGRTDSALVTVAAANSGTPAPPVLRPFNLSVTVGGLVAGSDSAWLPIAGALVTITRTTIAGADTVVASPLPPQTADANGKVRFEAVPGGAYRIAMVPPSGSPHAAATSVIPVQVVAEVSMQFVLARKP